LSDASIQAHRAVAVADTVPQGQGVTIGLLPGQDVFTVPSMALKRDAQLRGLGVGFLPEPLARPHIEAGHLVACEVQRPQRSGKLGYAWREAPGETAETADKRALQWWLKALAQPQTRHALLGQSSTTTHSSSV
jgi:DNA-binding transcriptional LysR family regulator